MTKAPEPIAELQHLAPAAEAALARMCSIGMLALGAPGLTREERSGALLALADAASELAAEIALLAARGTVRLTGREAIDYARRRGATLSTYADPTADARDDVTPEEADEIAAEDPALVYVDAPRGAA